VVVRIGDVLDQLPTEGGLGRPAAAPQPGQHRQRDRPVQERQVYHDRGDHEGVAAGRLAAVGGPLVARRRPSARRAPCARSGGTSCRRSRPPPGPRPEPASRRRGRTPPTPPRRRSTGRRRRTGAPGCDAMPEPSRPRSALRTPCDPPAPRPARRPAPRMSQTRSGEARPERLQHTHQRPGQAPHPEHRRHSSRRGTTATADAS
jgi:hypothetical protein